MKRQRFEEQEEPQRQQQYFGYKYWDKQKPPASFRPRLDISNTFKKSEDVVRATERLDKAHGDNDFKLRLTPKDILNQFPEVGQKDIKSVTEFVIAKTCHDIKEFSPESLKLFIKKLDTILVEFEEKIHKNDKDYLKDDQILSSAVCLLELKSEKMERKNQQAEKARAHWDSSKIQMSTDEIIERFPDFALRNSQDILKYLVDKTGHRFDSFTAKSFIEFTSHVYEILKNMETEQFDKKLGECHLGLDFNFAFWLLEMDINKNKQKESIPIPPRKFNISISPRDLLERFPEMNFQTTKNVTEFLVNMTGLEKKDITGRSLKNFSGFVGYLLGEMKERSQDDPLFDNDLLISEAFCLLVSKEEPKKPEKQPGPPSVTPNDILQKFPNVSRDDYDNEEVYGFLFEKLKLDIRNYTPESIDNFQSIFEMVLAEIEINNQCPDPHWMSSESSVNICLQNLVLKDKEMTPEKKEEIVDMEIDEVTPRIITKRFPNLESVTHFDVGNFILEKAGIDPSSLIPEDSFGFYFHVQAIVDDLKTVEIKENPEYMDNGKILARVLDKLTLRSVQEEPNLERITFYNEWNNENISQLQLAIKHQIDYPLILSESLTLKSLKMALDIDAGSKWSKKSLKSKLQRKLLRDHPVSDVVKDLDSKQLNSIAYKLQFDENEKVIRKTLLVNRLFEHLQKHAIKPLAYLKSVMKSKISTDLLACIEQGQDFSPTDMIESMTIKEQRKHLIALEVDYGRKVSGYKNTLLKAIAKMHPLTNYVQELDNDLFLHVQAKSGIKIDHSKNKDTIQMRNDFVFNFIKKFRKKPYSQFKKMEITQFPEIRQKIGAKIKQRIGLDLQDEKELESLTIYELKKLCQDVNINIPYKYSARQYIDNLIDTVNKSPEVSKELKDFIETMDDQIALTIGRRLRLSLRELTHDRLKKSIGKRLAKKDTNEAIHFLKEQEKVTIQATKEIAVASNCKVRPLRNEPGKMLCYLNSAVNCLHALQTLDFVGDNPVHKCLNDLETMTQTDTEELRKLLESQIDGYGGGYAAGQQQDARDPVLDILATVPSGERETILNEKFTCTSTGCDQVSENDTKQPAIFSVIKSSTEDMLANFTTEVVKHCPKCGENCTHRVDSQRKSGPDTKVLILRAQRDVDPLIKDNRPIRVNQTVHLGNDTYEIRSVVTHIGANLGSGHYVCHFYSRRYGWQMMNDDKLHPAKSPKHGYIFFYEKLDKYSPYHGQNQKMLEEFAGDTPRHSIQVERKRAKLAAKKPC